MSEGKRNREARRAERTARRNHLVPRFYLARFGDQHGRLAAIRRGTGAMHVASAKKLCAEVDFYTFVDVEGKESDELEDLLARFESQAAPAFGRVTVGPRVPTPSDDDRALILNFIGFQVARGRYFRHQYNAMADFMIKLMQESESRDPGLARDRLRQVMGEEPDDGDLDAWLDRLNNPDGYTFEPHMNESIQAGLNVGARVVDALAPRPWVVRGGGPAVAAIADHRAQRRHRSNRRCR